MSDLFFESVADRDRLVGPGMTGATCINLLNGLAWMGELSKQQIHRIWFPDYSGRTVQRALTLLKNEGLVRQINWNYQHQDQENPEKEPEKPAPGKPPNRRKVLYTLVDDTTNLIRPHTMYPFKPRGKGQKRYRDHDYHSNEMIAYTILHGRRKKKQMSGLFLYYEYYLNPPHQRPRSDVLIVIHTLEDGYPYKGLVPWTRFAGVRDEGWTNRIALETDRGSEPISVLAGKADAYANCGRKHWIDAHGHMPTPCWIVKDEERLWQLWNAWKEVWPQGFWRITTDAWLPSDRWYEYFQGEEFYGDQTFSVFDPVASWRPGTEAYARREKQGRLDFRVRK
jgi:hypothetical protein